MPVINKNNLARDEIARVDELGKEWHSSGKLSRAKLFRYRSVINSLDLEKVSLPGFDARAILTSFPFHERIFLQFCSHCCFDGNVLKPLLETGQVIPILIGSYKFYKASVEWDCVPACSAAIPDSLRR